MSTPKPYFENLGSKFEEWADPFDVQRRQELFCRMFLAVPPKGGALEIGCGYGALTQDFQKYFDFLSVLDISMELSERVSAKFGIPGWTADALKLPFDNGSIENIVSSECIEHTGNPKSAVAEMCRVLKSGGRIYLSTPNKLWSPVIRLGTILKIRKFRDREIFVSIRQLKSVMEQNGVQLLHVNSCHLIPWQLPFAKSIIRMTDRFGSRLHHISVNIAVVGQKTE